MSLKHALVVLLLDNPCSASQIQSTFAKTASSVWPLNIGQVAQTLNRFQHDGYVEPARSVTGQTAHTAETYAISDSGRQLVSDWFNTPIIQPIAERLLTER